MKKQGMDTGVKILFAICLVIVLLFLGLVAFIAVQISKPVKNEDSEIEAWLSTSFVSEVDSQGTSSLDENTQGLDRDYSRLELVNSENPLAEDYDYEGNLATIDKKYLCGSLNKMDKDALLYATEMIEAAWKDNVELYILSPYRSYSTQDTLFNNEVTKLTKSGLNADEAEIKAATVVAKAGTSEHHTGLAIDFNIAEDSFANSESYRWLLDNAENYGFIMRYSVEKQPITGIINESWHWRFVGINHAKAINSLDMCLEEYIDYLNNTAENVGSTQ